VEAQQHAQTAEELKALIMEKDRNAASAQQHAAEVEKRILVAELRFAAAEERAAESEKRAVEADARAEAAEQRFLAAEERMNSASDALGEATGRAAEVLQRMTSIKQVRRQTSTNSNQSTAASFANSPSYTPRITRKDSDVSNSSPPTTRSLTPEAPMGVFKPFRPVASRGFGR